MISVEDVNPSLVGNTLCFDIRHLMSSTYSPRQVESNLSDTDEMQSEEECECSPRLILITQN
jgi:hypothetical protein